jgi:2-polyprenyl-6-methoxyphenol hydroxylase-like FAD-dependent oxidoreductase
MTDAAVDVLIMGAGPAGVGAALRLRQLGYRVMLIERSAVWPRKQVGEALTPGVQNIIALLDANDALAAVPHLAGRPSRLLWRGRAADMVADSGSAMVDRAAFDAALLALAQQRGVQIERPAQAREIGGGAGDWRVELRLGEAGVKHIAARHIIDASGRTGQGRERRLDCAPRLAAMWAEIPAAGLPAELLQATQTEALEHGWLWGAALPGQRYRVMLVFDPGAARAATSGGPAERMRAACAASQLFACLAGQAGGDVFQMCSATPYLMADSWQDGRMKIGDAAFALDPISSSGVEKAMRFSLQAAVAVHTLLSDRTAASAALARDFFEHRLVETCARHAHWTANSYRQAWCGDRPFWRARSDIRFGPSSQAAWPELQARLYQASAQLQGFQEPELRPLASLDPARALRLSAKASLVQVPCVIADRVRLHTAVAHPHLERPLAFLENEALFPHLERLKQAQTLDTVLRQFGSSMPEHKARKITAWLWRHGLIDSVR